MQQAQHSSLGNLQGPEEGSAGGKLGETVTVGLEHGGKVGDVSVGNATHAFRELTRIKYDRRVYSDDFGPRALDACN